MTLECSSSSSSSSLPNGKHQFESSIGCLISLISNCGSRFEGVIDHLDLEDRRVMIRNVRCYGTEGRGENGIEIMPSNVVVEYMLFSRSQVKSLSVTRSGCLPRKREASLDYKTALVGRSDSNPNSPPVPSFGPRGT